MDVIRYHRFVSAFHGTDVGTQALDPLFRTFRMFLLMHTGSGRLGVRRPHRQDALPGSKLMVSGYDARAAAWLEEEAQLKETARRGTSTKS